MAANDTKIKLLSSESNKVAGIFFSKVLMDCSGLKYKTTFNCGDTKELM